MLDRFHSARIDVPDLDAAVADYTRLLGRAPSFTIRGEAGAPRRVFFAATNMALELRPREDDSARAGLSRLRLSAGTADPRDALDARGLAHGDATQTALVAAEAVGPAAWQEVVLDPAGTRGTPLSIAWGEDADLSIGPLAAASTEVAGVDPAEQIHGLDHVVVLSPAPEPTRALFGDALGIRMALDKTFEERGVRLIFFRLGGVTIEIGARLVGDPAPEKSDRFGGLAWQVRDLDAVHARLARDGFDVSDVRKGHKPGTRVCTVRDPVHAVPTLLIQPVQSI